MTLPRWTAYVALAVILVLAVSGVPNKKEPNPAEGVARDARAAAGLGSGDVVPARHPRTVVLGIDGLDPEILARVVAEHPERMSSFRRLMEAGQGVRSLGTSTPPQSPVAWSNFITGRDPGGHGIFDFIHRDPESYFVAPSTVKLEAGGAVHLPFSDMKLPTGGGMESNRTGRAWWGLLADAGVAADLYRVPIDYPVEPSKGQSFPGMLTPALDSAYGTYSMYTSDPPPKLETSGGRFVPVRAIAGRIATRLNGPPNAFKEGDPPATTPLTIYIDDTSQVATLSIGGMSIVMEPGDWTELVPVTFDMLPGGAMPLAGRVRFHLLSIEPEFELYASPVNFDPASPADTISHPASASAELAEDLGGAYYTQGMAEEVSALKDKAFTDAQFMDQVDLVYRERLAMLDRALNRYAASEEGGVLFFYVSTVDLSMHMMWRHQDREHPFFEASVAAEDSTWWSGRDGTTWEDVVTDLYLKMDPVLGAVLDRVGDDALVIVMSDHGFAPYRRKFSLNTWLLEEGYLVLKDGVEREKPEGDSTHADVHLFAAVDWSKTKAYGIGFNGLYLNRVDRESEGIVTDSEAPELLAEIKVKLEALRDVAPGRPWDGERVVLVADLASDVYSPKRVAEAPDIVVGYNSGYGNSDESTQGRIPNAVLSDNLGGTFNGSHLMHPSVVNGTVLTNGNIQLADPRLEDVTRAILDRYGVAPEEGMTGRPMLAR